MENPQRNREIFAFCFQTRKEREIQQQVLIQDEETLELRETFTSLQQEVEAKTKKLKKVKYPDDAEKNLMHTSRNTVDILISTLAHTFAKEVIDIVV